MNKYSGKIFELIWLENGHALMRSETRRDVFHSVDVHEGTCSCENHLIDKNPNCKHLIFLRAVQSAITELRDQDARARALTPTFLTPTSPRDGDLD